jgi:hypothetical protein
VRCTRAGSDPRGTARVRGGFARQRSVNHTALTLCSAGPWDRGNACRRRPKGRAAGGAWAGGGLDRGSGVIRACAHQLPHAGRSGVSCIGRMRHPDRFSRHPTDDRAAMRRQVPQPRRCTGTRVPQQQRQPPPANADPDDERATLPSQPSRRTARPRQSRWDGAEPPSRRSLADLRNFLKQVARLGHAVGVSWCASERSRQRLLIYYPLTSCSAGPWRPYLRRRRRGRRQGLAWAGWESGGRGSGHARGAGALIGESRCGRRSKTVTLGVDDPIAAQDPPSAAEVGHLNVEADSTPLEVSQWGAKRGSLPPLDFAEAVSRGCGIAGRDDRWCRAFRCS